MTKKAVYVVGAGASAEANLPVGSVLKTNIAQMLRMEFEYGRFKDGNYDLYAALARHTGGNKGELGKYLKACIHIRNNMPLAISIDNFIDTERNDEKVGLCGKVAIVDSILRAEKNSKLYFDAYSNNPSINFSGLENTWYLPFFRSLTENCSAGDLPGRLSNITLVIFNYDRCIEHFLYHALITYYRLSKEVAADLIDKISIIHPYGTVGKLPWQIKPSPSDIPFGSETNWNNVIESAGRIRTFTEEAESASAKSIRSKMQNPEQLVFLGFAFHKLNMELLSSADLARYKNTSTVQCYATAHETSKADQRSIETSINSLYEGPFVSNIENMSCFKLFQDYSRSLGYV